MGSWINEQQRGPGNRRLRRSTRYAAISGSVWTFALSALLACSSEPRIVGAETASGEVAGAGAGGSERDAATTGASGRMASGTAGSSGARSSSTGGRGGSAADKPQATAGRDGVDAPGDQSEPDPSADDAGAAGAPAMMPPPRSTEPAAPDEIIVPAETADEEALQRLATWNDLPLFRSQRYEQQSSHDRGQANGAEEMLLPLLAYDNRDMNNFICRSADAQAATVLIGYHYDRETCEESYARGVVLARHLGSGRLARLWMTVSSVSTPSGMIGNEMLRVYVDDNPRPFVQARLADVMSGQAGEIFAPPFGAGSKAFIAWYYPVVFGSKLIVTLDRLNSDYYFQTDVVFDTEPKPRFAPASRLAARDLAKQQLTAAAPAGSTPLANESFALAKDQNRSVTTPGPATVRELRLEVAKDKLAALASVRLSVRWNGAEQPAIDLPILDLFASRRAIVAKGNLALAATTEGDAQVLALRLPMPFETSAEWTLTQTGDATAEFQLAWLGVKDKPAETFGHLHVQQREVPLPAMQVEQTVAEASGRGRFVGLCFDLEGRPDTSLGVFGTAPLNFLEGDIRATVDGKLALDGTGTEDYPDNSFYFRDTPAATPFSQNWNLVDNAGGSPPGAVSFCRWQVFGSEVDFQNELRVTHEMAIGDASIVLLHRSVSFLYLP